VLEDLVAELDGEALTVGEELVAVLEGAAVRSVELRGALDCTEAGGETDDLGPIPGSCAKDSMDATAPVEPSGADSVESGAVEAEDGDEATGGTDGASEPAAGDEPAGSAEEPQTDPTTSGASDPATTGEPSSAPEDEDVLGELTGILSDLFE
jgi:hypothetical protein